MRAAINKINQPSVKKLIIRLVKNGVSNRFPSIPNECNKTKNH